ncbi:MAG: elongation factor P [Chloroflexi bacterium]|nr:elongation factor P [Chloroflexota bacterium]
MTISSSEIRRNMTILLEGEVYQVLEWQHRKPPKAPPTLTLKVRHVLTGNVYEKKVQGNRSLTRAPVENKEMQYLYFDGNDYAFMDNETFDQSTLTADQLGDAMKYITEGANVEVMYYEGRPISVDIPPHVNLEVTQADPAVKGNTATGATKQVTLSTGHQVMTPLFVDVGDTVRVDTRTGDYVERL